MCRKSIYLISFVLGLSLVLMGVANAAEPSLVLYLPFDEGGGEPEDFSMYNHEVELVNNPQWTDGKNGKALEFDGTNYVRIPINDTLQLIETFTVEFWVKREASQPATWNYMVAGGNLKWAVIVNADQNVYVYTRSGGTWAQRLVTSIPLTTDWTHIAMTYDVGSGVELYFNAEKAGEGGSPPVVDEIDDSIMVGARVPGQEFFAGIVDEVALYNRILSLDEIRQDMKAVGEPWPYASMPSPEDGAMLTEFMSGMLGYSLSWEPGAFAVSHDVYFGDNFDDVNEGTGDTFRGNQSTLYFLAGYGYTPNDPVPDGFVPGTTYYWRIDEVNDANDESPWKGDVWSFSLPATEAYTPSPVDGAKFVDPNADLSWKPGFGAVVQTVYFGDDYDTVANAIEGGTGVGTPTYDPGPLETEKTYYWRVDTVGAFGPATGDVWSFTTARLGGGLRGDFYHWSGDFPPSQPFQIFVLSRIDPQINFSWGDDGGDTTLRGINSPDPLVNVNNFACIWVGEVEAAFTETYTFYTTTDDGARLWIDGQQIINRWVEQGDTEHSGTIDLVAGQKYSIEMHHYENGGGATAQLRWSSPSTPKQVIPQAALSPPVKASGPNPPNGATGVKMTPTLTWNPGDHAVSHQVYFGTDADAVLNATTASPEYISTRALGDESYEPGKLAWDSTYYWRIDEVNNLNPDSPWKGNLWSFTTGDFLVVDNFEDYDAEDQIWYNWVDGLGYVKPDTPPNPGNGTGSEVGDSNTASFTEETIIHGGSQSMPFKYNNNNPLKLKYSETKLTLSAQRNWTEEGVKALSLWFRGNPPNYLEDPPGTFTFSADGADIWGGSDEFRYVYKQLSGDGEIIARVVSIGGPGDNEWRKAGVMIRETLVPASVHAFMAVTPEPSHGLGFQYRDGVDLDDSDSEHGVDNQTAPYWVRLVRQGNQFTGYHSPDGVTWTMKDDSGIEDDAMNPVTIPMASNVYIGLALTSHQSGVLCVGQFSDVSTSSSVTGSWQLADIGTTMPEDSANDAEPMYVAIANNTGQPAVVVHDNPNAAQIDTWTEWNIDLRDFTGINLADVNSIAIGLGNRNNPQAGGSGKMYFDDIALYRPRCVPDKVTLSEADLNSDCVVDFRDLEIMTGNWLAVEPDPEVDLEADLNSDGTVDFKDYAVLADDWLDEQIWPDL